MAQQIQLRNGTAAQWTSANTTLALGEIGIESDTSKFKIGNGTLAWNALNYVYGLSWQGAYSAGTTYSVNDLVYSGGSTYLSRVGNNTANALPSGGATSTTYWAVLALGSDVTTTNVATLTNKTLTLPIIDNPKLGYATTATAAGTTTLSVTSAHQQFFTGTTTQTVVLPVTSTLVVGMSYSLENNSTGLVTVQSSGLNTVATVPSGTTALFTCTGTTLTTAADWDLDYIGFTTLTGTGSNVLATSPTLADPILADTTLTRAMLKDTGYSYYNSGATSALDYTNGSVQRWAPSGTATLSIANWPPSGNLGEIFIEGVNLGAATITWPSINWVISAGGTVSTFSSNGVTLQTSGTDWILIWTRDAGTTLFGKVVR